MRQRNAHKWLQFEANCFKTRRDLTAKIFGATALFTLLAILLTTLFSPQTATITHAQQRSSGLLSPFSAESAQANEIKTADKEEQSNELISDEPQTAGIAGGDGCGWTAGTVYPINVLDNVAVTIGNNIYSFGGVSASTVIATSYRFDGTAWTAIAPLPTPLEKPAVVTDGTSAYITGGVSTGSAVSTALYRYNPATNDYTTLAPATTAVWTHSSALLNGKIYKIAGFTTGQGAPTNVVEAYDIATNTWATVAPYPQAVGWTSAFTLGSSIYVAGGTGAGPTAKTYRYNPATNIWDDAAFADLPSPRWGSASAVYDNGLLMAAGVVGTTPAATNTVVKWNPASNTWADYPSALQTRFRTTGAVLTGAFYAIGGAPSTGGFVGTNDNQRLLCPPTTAPVVIGSVTYVSENGTPPNNTPDPGETVTVSLSLENVGSGNTGANVTATLQATGGIVPVTTTQNYGTLNAGGPAVSRNFTFTVPASAVCGSQITLTFNIQDGSTTNTVTQTYTLGTRSATFSQNFDGVTPPALPAGWTQVATGSNTGWVTSTTNPDSAPNSAFNPQFATPGGADLESPATNIATASGVINFRLRFVTEATWDGAILEIKIGSGAYQEFTAAGGTFTAGAYNSTARGTGNPLGTTSRPAWSGNSNGYINVSGTLPASANGQSVQFKWRTGHDDTITPANSGVNIDNVVVQGAFQCSTVGPTAPTNSRADFDGDGRTDVSVFRNGTWFAQRSTAGFIGVNWGAAGDQLAPGDYNGDNRTDFAIYRPTATVGTADFLVLFSDTNTFAGIEWGTTGDVVKVGDYDGNNRDDYAVYRSSNNTWYVLTNPGSTFVQYNVGAAGNTPVQLDFDGDNRTDPAAWVPSTGLWTIRRSSDGTNVSFNWGTTGDIPVPADYLGNDNRDEVVVFRAGQWLVRLDNGQLAVINWGAPTDIPVPGDYDGDGRDDQAVYRGGTWFVLGTTSNLTTTFGAAGDIPVPRAYTPNN